jgi:hypothetical protein
MTKLQKLILALASLPTLALLNGCGGGGDDNAGAPAAFQVVPATVTFTAPTGLGTGVCLAGGSARVFVYGGAAPYHIDNTDPADMTLDTDTVSSPGGSFNVTVTSNACLTTSSIVVVDKLNKIVVFQVTNSPSTAT